MACPSRPLSVVGDTGLPKFFDVPDFRLWSTTTAYPLSSVGRFFIVKRQLVVIQDELVHDHPCKMIPGHGEH